MIYRPLSPRGHDEAGLRDGTTDVKKEISTESELRAYSVGEAAQRSLQGKGSKPQASEHWEERG